MHPGIKETSLTLKTRLDRHHPDQLPGLTATEDDPRESDLHRTRHHWPQISAEAFKKLP
jgi:hypothetical protein